MRVIVAGGRDYLFTPWDGRFLDSLGVTLVIEGGCTGADDSARQWAGLNGVRRIRIKADWARHGRAAGPMRNRQMAEFLSGMDGDKAVVLFPGGRGTESMRREAERAGLRVIEPYASQGKMEF